MKKNKVIGIGVALMGVAVSVGSAFALYKKGFDQAQHFGFGGFHYVPSSGAFQFMSSLTSSGSTGFELESASGDLNPSNRVVKYKFKVAATYGSTATDAGLIRQDAILGKLSIEKTGTLAQYLTISAYVDGYAKKENDQHELVDTYWTKEASLGVRTLGGEGNTISAYIPTPTTDTTDISSLPEGKFLYVHVTLTLAELTDPQFMALNEASYSLNVTYGDIDASYGRPYIVGDGTNWTVEDEYAMVPNLAADNYEFCFKNLNSRTDHKFEAMKVLKNKTDKDTSDIWNTDKWLALGSAADVSQNIEIDSSKSYFVTYKGDDKGGFVVDNNTQNIYQN